MEKFFRFELAFENQPQNIGFLHGLDETGIPFANSARLYALFNGLPFPELDKSSRVSCWFTEAGLHRYMSAVDRVSDEITKTEWSLSGAAVEADPAEAVYRDELQAVFPLDYARTKNAQYRPVYHVKGFLDSIIKQTKSESR